MITVFLSFPFHNLTYNSTSNTFAFPFEAEGGVYPSAECECIYMGFREVVMLRTSSTKRLVSLLFTLALMFSSMGPLAQPAAASSASRVVPNPANSSAMQSATNYCDYGPVKPGSVGDYLAGAPTGADIDCLDIWVESQGCGYLDIRIADYVINWGFQNVLRWSEGQADVFGLRQSTFPISFAEDYNGGSVWVTVVLVAPERDYVLQAGPDAALYWSGNEVDQTFLIDTDCEQPEITTVLGCSQGYYINNGYGTDLTLAGVGIVTKYAGSTTLYDVLSNPGNGKMQRGVQTYDGYTRQQVTAYLNSLYVTGFELDSAVILAGGYDQATLEYYNHGATGENIVGVCPLG